MWRRLDDKYRDPTKVTDVIIDCVRRTKIIREGEDKRFIEFVDMLEDGYRDLKRLGLEAEITTTSSVSIIERKLPMDIRREWARTVSLDTSMVDKTNKFPSLLRFLLNQKRAIEYDCAALRTYSSSTASSKAIAHHAAAREYTDDKKNTIESVKMLVPRQCGALDQRVQVISIQIGRRKKENVKRKRRLLVLLENWTSHT